MTQDELWLTKYEEVVSFIETNRRNPSQYDPEERGKYGNWIKHNKKFFKAGELKEDRSALVREVIGWVRRKVHPVGDRGCRVFNCGGLLSPDAGFDMCALHLGRTLVLVRRLLFPGLLRFAYMGSLHSPYPFRCVNRGGYG